MVSIAPNLFHIEGIVAAIGSDDAPSNFSQIRIQLSKVEHLQGPAAFLDPSEKEIEVLLSAAAAKKLAKGTHLKCNVRRSPAGFMAITNSIEVVSKKNPD